MSAPSAEPASKTSHRRGALEPYVLTLTETLPRILREDSRDPQMVVAGIALPRDPWILSRIASRDSAEECPPGLPELLLNTLALLLKSGIDVARLRDGIRAGRGDLYALQAEMMLDSALGTTVLRELQNAVDALVRQGALPDAKSLSRIQQKLGEAVRELKRSIADSNRGPEEKAAEAPAGPPPPAAVEYGLDGPAEEPQPRRRRKPAAPADGIPAGQRAPRLRFSTTVLLVLVIAAASVRIFSSILPELSDHGSSPLTRGDFAPSAPILEVVARPPSLYAAIDERAWEAYERGEKLRLVDDMGSVLLIRGYQGLLLRTPDGRPLAQWLKTGGVRLLDSGPETETSVAATPAASPDLDRFVR